jgi:3-phenylpropionate/trans-cinnamate dioxygenase ferredoxin reductase subunit
VVGHVLVTKLDADDHVVVVGGGLAGWKFCEEVRRLGYTGAITLVGDELHAPYDRPPLSKQILVGKWTPVHSTLATPTKIADLAITVRLGERATGLDLSTTTVHLADGSSVAGTRVVIATGARARRLEVSADAATHVLRTRDDVTALLAAIERLDENDAVVIVGGGFIGAEAATQLHQRGIRAIVLEAAERPLQGALGELVARWLEPLAGDAGIELRSGVEVTDIRRHDEHLSVELGNGDRIDAAVVVVGVGAIPNDDWLATSGLTTDNGVVVDSMMMASDRVAAIGDVARFEWHNVAGTETVRIEHWQVANDHAVHLARHWVAGATHDDPLIPYFWSDQYAKKIQMLGHAHRDDDVEIVMGDVDERRWLALYSREGLVTGAVALSSPRALMLSRVLLESPTSLDDARNARPWSA